MYLDLCSDGLVVKGSAVESGGSPFVQFGPDAPIAVTAHVRNLRAVRTPDGRHIAAWKSQDGTGRMVDRATRIVVTIGSVYGDEAVALTPAGVPVSIASATHYRFGSSLHPLPATRLGTSQGIARADDDGSVIFADDQLHAPLRRGSIAFVQWQDIGGWIIGKSNLGAIAWHESSGKPYVITDANTPWAIRAQIVNGQLLCCTSLPGLIIAEQDFRPLASVVVPEFIHCDQPMAVGAWFDHDRPFLTHVDDGTGRFPQSGPLIKGVFLDNAHSELRPQASFLAKSLHVPTYGYGDGYDKVATWGDYAIIHAYLTPGESVEFCTNFLKHDIATAKVRGRAWGVAISLHRGATDDPAVFKRDEQMVLDMAAAAWRLAVTEGARFVYVFSWRQPKDGEPRDGVLRWSSFAEAYRRMRNAVPDPSDWPLPVATRPVPVPVFPRARVFA